MSYYDSYKLDAREWKNYGKHRVYVTVSGYHGDDLQKTYKLAWVDMDNEQKSPGNINAGNVPPRRLRGQKEKKWK